MEELLERTAIYLGVQIFVWTVADGLRPMGSGNPLPDGKSPAKALAAVPDYISDGIYFFKDLQRFFHDPEVVRRLCDAGQSLVNRRSAMVLSAARIEMPDEVQELTARFKLEFLRPEDLRKLADNVIAQLKSTQHIKVDLPPPDFDWLVQSLRG